VVGSLYSFVHRCLEKPFTKKSYYPKILELGGGDGQHLPFVNCNYDEYIISDITKPNEKLIKFLTTQKNIKFMQVDAHNLSKFKNDYFDRIIVTCLIVHLSDPYKALIEWRRVLKPGGQITIYVAPEPGFLLRLTRAIIFWPKARRLGNLTPWCSTYNEHQIHYLSATSSVKSVFRSDKLVHKRYPTKMVSWNFSFFDIFHLTKEK
jgi:phosphatidylethanolamine/phosphatidyl-N-methylethanolamine N-methyltransferase